MSGPGLYEQIKDDLGYLQWGRAVERFATLADDARRHDWTHIEFLARLVAEQADATRDRRLAARLRYAKFPYRRTIDDFDFEFQPSVDRKLVEDLATLRFITENRPILLLGQPGCGKTHLAVALATRAVEAFVDAHYGTGIRVTFAAPEGEAEPLGCHAVGGVLRCREFGGKLDGAVERSQEVVGDAEHLTRGVDLAEAVVGAPGADGIVVFEAETNGVHQLVATGAGGIFRVLSEAFTNVRAVGMQ